jgi:hypothetical protein
MDNDFKQTGFDLMVDSAFSEFDWDNLDRPGAMDEFYDMMTPHIKKYYPNATQISIAPPFKRAKLSLRAVNAPHLDLFPDDEYRNRFYEEHGVEENQMLLKCLLGHCDTEDDELGVILGAWVPVMRTPVCDKPLAMMDASSSSVNDVTPLTVKIPTGRLFGKTWTRFMIAAINWTPKQKWYYYPYQKSNEMLVFHHWNRDKAHAWANPHASFTVSGCGDEYEPRVSVEIRIALFFAKESQGRKDEIEKAEM